MVLGARRVDRIESLAGALTRRQGARRRDGRHQLRPGKRLVDGAVETYGRIDVMTNNAGLMPHSPLERLKIDEWNGRST